MLTGENPALTGGNVTSHSSFSEISPASIVACLSGSKRKAEIPLENTLNQSLGVSSTSSKETSKKPMNCIPMFHSLSAMITEAGLFPTLQDYDDLLQG